MNRFEIAISQHEHGTVRYEVTSSASMLEKVIEYCHAHKKGFDAVNQPCGPLETAVVNYCKAHNLALVVDNSKEALSLSVAYSFTNVHTLAFPPTKTPFILYLGNKTTPTYATITVIPPPKKAL